MNRKCRAGNVFRKKNIALRAAMSLALVASLLTSSLAFSMVEMEETQMSEVTGAGLAFVFDDFSLRFAPTSFTELTGSTPTASAALFGWQRGDARYYGISMTSGDTVGTDWFASNSAGGGCGIAPVDLGCPIGVGDGDFGVDAFASVYDPFVLRVFEYEGYNYDGAWLDQPAGSGTSTGPGATAMPTVLEIRGPAQSDAWRWAFWGELEIDRLNNDAAIGAPNNSVVGTGGANFLQSQTIILGKPVAEGFIWNNDTDTYSANPNGPRRSVQRWMYTTNSADQTFGVAYDSALSGDFRFSVRQTTGSPDALHQVPDFQNTEGLYFRNVDAFLPLGTLHYQSLTFSGVSEYDQNANKLANPTQNGNFAIELTGIPNNPDVYDHFYCGDATNDGVGDCALTGGAIANPNPDTHGYVRWGNWCTDAACTATIDPYGSPAGAGEYDLPTGTSTANGIYFVGSDPVDGAPVNGHIINLGISRIEGMLIQHMKITSLGAGAP